MAARLLGQWRRRAAVAVVATCGALMMSACGPRPAAPVGPAEFPARTEGSAEALASHLDGLEQRFQETPAADPQTARANLDAYTRAVIATATPLWEDPEALSALRTRAGEMILQSWYDRLEIDEAALPRLLEWADRIEAEAPPNSALPARAAYTRFLGLENAPASSFPDPEARQEALIDAALRLGRSKPPREETPGILNRLGDQALEEGRPDEAVALFRLLGEQFPDDPLGKRGAGIARRLGSHGEVIDDIEGKTLKDALVDVEDFRGKPVLVVFWATEWRPLDHSTLEAIEALRREHGPDRIAVLGVLHDASLPRAQRHMERHGIDWPQIFAPADTPTPSPSLLALKFGIETSPYFMVLDRSGRLVTTAETLDEVRPVLEAELASSQPDPAATTSAAADSKAGADASTAAPPPGAVPAGVQEETSESPQVIENKQEQEESAEKSG